MGHGWSMSGFCIRSSSKYQRRKYSRIKFLRTIISILSRTILLNRHTLHLPLGTLVGGYNDGQRIGYGGGSVVSSIHGQIRVHLRGVGYY